MRFWILISFVLLPLFGLAQGGTITGKVTRMDTNGALAKASIFLSNSSYGTSTNDDGTFTLSGVKPGQYELIVTMVGLEDHSQTVLIGKEPIKLHIALMPKVTQLREVVISTPESWRKNYEMFVKEFLGVSENAKNCKILNPKVLNFSYRKAKETLEAWSDEFVEIENKALGYKVKFLLKSFACDNLNNVISWEGKILFEEMPAKASQKKIWEAKRNDIYYGSSQHFFRSLQNVKLDEDGFIVMILQRKPNPKRPAHQLIMKNITKYESAGNIDSLNRWKNLYALRRYDETLIRRPLKETDITWGTDKEGIFALSFPDYLYVMYNRKLETDDLKDIYHPLNMPFYQTSIITLYKPYALFDRNGSIITGGSTLIEGTWSKSKVAELLPVDYVPGDMVLTEK
ncbi:carboxypeptidase-like regulatory domain-containing protein [Mucilaginibacter myungsuensis]|uniref:Carboxypeptidase-like regulatory domain-containing protein n=1 Tax=Mucilaginibacter myungsuensis TaxID=649104 RepID=A0A929PW30_9SPHI|nr:carboxypeptidase-like regulatory domain-containing protein [Mucilaginibacter myungsuensis]MBE9660935.1 carboxypeptidase-like regulatory domain-containing protein [Mucilaginibacter myungsuensis]MDN3600981.1 carboxypeptidase-like regulatory domain-containing protein [Mucilaginibacter myungsuensis]